MSIHQAAKALEAEAKDEKNKSFIREKIKNIKGEIEKLKKEFL